jgi:hypothetical protein
MRRGRILKVDLDDQDEERERAFTIDAHLEMTVAERFEAFFDLERFCFALLRTSGADVHPNPEVVKRS